MAIKSNAKTADDKADFKALKDHFKRELKGKDVELEFEDRHVVLYIEAQERRMTRRKWGDWVAGGFPTDPDSEHPFPPASAGQRKAAAAKPEAPVRAAVAAVNPRDKVGPSVEAAPDFLDDLAHRALELGMEERRGEQGRNAARFRRGDLMVTMNNIARAHKRKAKDVLSELNERTLALAERNAILGFEPVTEQEASTTRRVVEAFGSSGAFRLVNAVNKLTGEPLVADNGEPLLVNLTDVAMNKLAPLTSAANEDHDVVLSFAYRHSEKVVKKARAVAKATERPLAEVIAEVDAARVDAVHPVTGAVIQVQPEGKDAFDFLGAMVGEAPTADVVSIKTSRGWYETFFEPLRALYSAAAKKYAPGLAHDGENVSNVFVLEHIINQYFNVHEEEGRAAALLALVDGEVLTKAQAQNLNLSLTFNPTSGEWEGVEAVVQVDAAVVAAVADDLADDDLEWDDDGDDDDDDDDWGDEEE